LNGRHVREGQVRIAGEKAQGKPTAAGAAADPAAGQAPEAGLSARQRRRRRVWITLGVVAVLLIGTSSYAAYEVTSEQNANPSLLRPSDIPANISTSLVNLMQLSSIPHVPAPGFTFTDQRGHALSLASLRGKIVVLEFMDPHCTDICPIVSQEFVDAYHELHADANKVVFAAINVNQYHASVADMEAFSAAHQLTTIPSWHFFTGPIPALRTAWRDYDIAVEAPNPNADIIHTSSVYFIDARGAERYVATPMADHTANGTAYLPPDQIAAWASGIARLAQDLAR
jgi:cytochrome oxidase Cu insertion factor (SCO1/SenC/PrrC family)